MKVALVSRLPQHLDQPRGGVETVTLALAAALAEMDNVDVHVLTIERQRRQLKIETGLGATIHRLPGSRWPQILDILAGPGRARLRRYIYELAPDVVHLHETYGLGIGDLRIPKVFTVHGFDHANLPAEKKALTWLRAPLWKRVESWGLARQRHVISITPYVREHISPLTKAVIHDIDNPVNPACFTIERREVPGRIFFAGWISPRKNPLTLVRALGLLVQRGVSVNLHLAGEESDPPYAQQVRQAIAELNLTDRVKMLGRISANEIRRELSEAGIFALPALQENAPMAISEAMAAGIPVVSSNTCGMPFMIDENINGFLVEPEDPAMLADRLGRLLENDELRRRMGQSARESAHRRFHPISVALKTKAVYDELLRESV